MMTNSVTMTGTTETSLLGSGTGSLTISANTITAGSLIEFSLSGTLSAVLSAGITIKIYSGSSGTTQIGSFAPSLSLLNSVGWTATVKVVCKTIGATGTLQCNGTLNVGTNSIVYTQQSISNFDTTGANTFKITGTWGAVNVGNSITSNLASASYTFPP